MAIVENLGWSQAEIASAGEAAHHAVQSESEKSVTTSVDVSQGLISIYVPDEATAERAEAVVAESNDEMRSTGTPYSVSVSLDPALQMGEDVDYNYLYGGGALTSCTAGFTVETSTYSSGIITADHCPNTQSFGIYPLTHRGGSSTRDVQWHSTSATHSEPELHWGFNGIYGVNSTANPVEGQTLCRDGVCQGG